MRQSAQIFSISKKPYRKKISELPVQTLLLLVAALAHAGKRLDADGEYLEFVEILTAGMMEECRCVVALRKSMPRVTDLPGCGI